MIYAHSKKNTPLSEWQTLDEHLHNVAEMCDDFARQFNSASFGKLLGFVHDIGKSRKAFQDYLLHCNEMLDKEYANLEHSHSGVGACYLNKKIKALGFFLAYCIAGHHAGLPDGSADSGAASLKARLDIEKHILDEYEVCLWLEQNDAQLAQYISEALPPKQFMTEENISLWLRMLFSCLVDADFLDTEHYMDPQKSGFRSSYDTISILADRFFVSLNKKLQGAPDTPVNQIRTEIRKQCEEKAKMPPGIFSLTVPTGGGKTLSSMAFAFKHALQHNKRRIIYVIPYTSIIEQTSAILRELIGEDSVLEHHSNFDSERATLQSNLASENWDAPVIVTTTVQFFESFYACNSSRCRKLHNVIDSIVILDEVQLLPPTLLQPCKDVIRQLSENYGVTFVMSTATQPNHEGLNVTEIIPDSMQLFSRLKRVDVKFPDKIDERRSWEEVADELIKYDQVLCIVNERSHCRALFEQMPPGTIHLSALMCGNHRSKVIADIKNLLKQGAPIRVISTNLVEAGVDIDFPVVFRAYAGLPSIMQSAGRCNREGKLNTLGKTFVFMPPEASHAGELKKAEDTLTEFLSLPDKYSLDNPASYPEYFKMFYNKINDTGTDFKRMLVDKVREGIIQFRQAEEKFRMIDDQSSYPLIVRYGNNDSAIEALTFLGPRREIMRKLQRSTVNIPRHIMEEFIRHHLVREIHPGIYLQEASDLYTESFGVDTKCFSNEMKDLFC